MANWRPDTNLPDQGEGNLIKGRLNEPIYQVTRYNRMLTKCLLRKIPIWKERPWRGDLVHLWKRSHLLMPALVCIYPILLACMTSINGLVREVAMDYPMEYHVDILYWFLGKLRCNINSYDRYAHIKTITHTHMRTSWNSISTKRNFPSLSSRRTD